MVEFAQFQHPLLACTQESNSRQNSSAVFTVSRVVQDNPSSVFGQDFCIVDNSAYRDKVSHDAGLRSETRLFNRPVAGSCTARDGRAITAEATGITYLGNWGAVCCYRAVGCNLARAVQEPSPLVATV